MEYGLIGARLIHSFSKEIHELLGYEYELVELKKEELAPFFKAKAFKAINVTIPYKKDVMPFLDEIDDHAKAIGAVNTVVNENGRLIGHNTDFSGMTTMLLKNGFELENAKVLILGSGGTATTSIAVCKAQKARDVIIVSRSGEVNYDNVKLLHGDADYIINTTPCGMYPDNDGMPISLDGFENLKGVADAIYNPLKTRLVLEAEKRGLNSCGGLYMLTSQGVSASEFFLGKKYDEKVFDEVYSSLISQKQNIVLIGMPACGKTTVSAVLSERLGRKVVDSDKMIEEKTQTKIADIFARYGEKYFRQLEKETIAEISKMSCIIVSTGGGSVMDSENVERLKQNGKMFFLDRPLEELLPDDSRPLSKSRELLVEMYERRHPIYESIADVTITNFETVEKTVSLIEEKV